MRTPFIASFPLPIPPLHVTSNYLKFSSHCSLAPPGDLFAVASPLDCPANLLSFFNVTSSVLPSWTPFLCVPISRVDTVVKQLLLLA